MTILKASPCPRCGILLQPHHSNSQKVPAATSFINCLRRCDTCRIGISNTSAEGRATFIYEDPQDNVPPEVRQGFLQAINASVSDINRANKATKAGFSTSEDALTWTIFRWLQIERRLGHTLAAIGVSAARNSSAEPNLILWGAETPQNAQAASPVPRLLAAIADRLGEAPTRRTEPDIVLDCGASGVVIIEAKFRSPNDKKKSDYGSWPRYLGGPDPTAFTDPSRVSATGYYELARNWRYAWDVSRDLVIPMAVVNLGRPQLFAAREGQELTEFENLLAQDARHRFHRATWRQLLQANEPLPNWLTQYLARKAID